MSSKTFCHVEHFKTLSQLERHEHYKQTIVHRDYAMGEYRHSDNKKFNDYVKSKGGGA